LPELEKILGAAFESGAGPSKPPGPGGERSSRTTLVDFPDLPGNRLVPVYGTADNHLDFLIRYQLRPTVTQSEEIKVRLHIHIAQDVDLGQGEPLAVSVTDQKTERKIAEGENPELQFTLSPGQARVFRVRSGKYPRHQVLLFRETEVTG
jgi:hypothetical protein